MANKNSYDFVLDCSITMAWLFEDEATSSTDGILEALEKGNCIVPSIWSLEVANVLLIAQRKKRITAIQASGFIDALSYLPIHIDASTMSRAMHSIYALAVQEQLTIYDAAYLELAIRENIPLATKDHDLLTAAKRLQIKIQ